MDGVVGSLDNGAWPPSGDGDVHVMPNFGREHRDTSECWCRPQPLPDTLDRSRYAHTVWVHEPEN